MRLVGYRVGQEDKVLVVLDGSQAHRGCGQAPRKHRRACAQDHRSDSEEDLV